MKILVVNSPGYGHNIPTIGFITELVKKGHTVDVISSSYMVSTINELMLKTGANFTDIKEAKEELVSEETKNTAADNDILSYCNIMIKMLMTVNEYINKNNYDVIIYDYFVFPVYYYSESNKIPAIRFFSCIAYNEIISNRYNREKESECKQNVWASEYGRIIIKELRKKGFKFNTETMGDEITYNIPELNIVNLIKDMQPYAEDFDGRFIYVGSSINNPTINVEIPYEKMKGKIIYISMGTHINVLEPDRGKSLFEKYIEAFKDENADVIMTIGTDLTIDEFPVVPNNFYLYNFVPQTDVLQHIDLFITHAGMNSINESIYYGVPMLALPGGSDQFIMAEQIEARKIGCCLSRDKASPKRIKKLAFDILADTEINSNIQNFKNSMRRIDTNKKIVELIENYNIKNNPYK